MEVSILSKIIVPSILLTCVVGNSVIPIQYVQYIREEPKQQQHQYQQQQLIQTPNGNSFSTFPQQSSAQQQIYAQQPIYQFKQQFSDYPQISADNKITTQNVVKYVTQQQKQQQQQQQTESNVNVFFFDSERHTPKQQQQNQHQKQPPVQIVRYYPVNTVPQQQQPATQSQQYQQYSNTLTYQQNNQNAQSTIYAKQQQQLQPFNSFVQKPSQYSPQVAGGYRDVPTNNRDVTYYFTNGSAPKAVLQTQQQQQQPQPQKHQQLQQQQHQPQQHIWHYNQPASTTTFNNDNEIKIGPLLPAPTEETPYNGTQVCSQCCDPNEHPCTNCCGIGPFISATALKTSAG